VSTKELPESHNAINDRCQKYLWGFPSASGRRCVGTSPNGQLGWTGLGERLEQPSGFIGCPDEGPTIRPYRHATCYDTHFIADQHPAGQLPVIGHFDADYCTATSTENHMFFFVTTQYWNTSQAENMPERNGGRNIISQFIAALLLNSKRGVVLVGSWGTLGVPLGEPSQSLVNLESSDTRPPSLSDSSET
jgi:hypothetical protein